MKDEKGLSRMLLIAIVVVVVVVAAVAFMLLPKEPAAPTTTTTSETTSETTPTRTETTETTPTATTTTPALTTTPTTTATTPTTPVVTTTTPTTPATTTTETFETTPTATVPEIRYTAPETVLDLLSVAKSMTYQWTGPDGVGRHSYEFLGEESIEGEATWKVKIQLTNGDTSEFIVWISRVDGSVKQGVMDGTTLTGEMAGLLDASVAGLMMPFQWFAAAAEMWEEYWDIPKEYGVVTYQGSEAQSFGPTTLTVQKFLFEPNLAYEGFEDTKYLEWAFAEMDGIGIATHFKIETRAGEVFAFDLVSITRA